MPGGGSPAAACSRRAASRDSIASPASVRAPWGRPSPSTSVPPTGRQPLHDGIGWQSIRPGLDTMQFYPPAPIAPPPPARRRPAIARADRGLLVGRGHRRHRSADPRALPGHGAPGAGNGDHRTPIFGERRNHGCTVAIGSGDAALDDAACEIARTLDLRYVEPCTDCRRAARFPCRSCGDGAAAATSACR